MGAMIPDDIPWADRLGASLQGQGHMTQGAWRVGLRQVPRHLFVPDRAWAMPDDTVTKPYGINRQADPNSWMSAVYSNSSIVIQRDDGDGDPAGETGLASSSVSAPGVVIEFMELLDPREGDRVMDVGTGSGWTASLLAWKGCDVTSIEVDPQVSTQAAKNIEAAGFTPHLIVGDGAAGAPERAPFDRVHVTAGVPKIPMTWIEQTRPGGVIVMPWQPGGSLGHKLRLTVVNDSTAVGSFHGPANYMTLRDQRPNTTWESHHYKEADTTRTRVDPRVIAEAGLGAQAAIAMQAPGIGWHFAQGEHDGLSMLVYERTDRAGSWAACDHERGADDFAVTQYGERRLWDEVEAAFLRWCSFGRPAQDRLGLTVTPEGLTLWLDNPAIVIGSS